MDTALSILWVAMRSVLKFFLTSIPGAIMHALGYIKRDSIGDMAKLLYYVLFPCLIFSKISTGISVESLRIAWPLVLYPSLQCIFGFFFAKLLSIILGVSRGPLESVLAVTLMFSNYGNLPYMIINSITSDIYPYSKDQTALNRGFAYSSLFLFTSSAWMWSFGPYYMTRGSRSKKSASLPPDKAFNDTDISFASPHLSTNFRSDTFFPDTKSGSAPDHLSTSSCPTQRSPPSLQQVVPLEQLRISLEEDENTPAYNHEIDDGSCFHVPISQHPPTYPICENFVLQQPLPLLSRLRKNTWNFFRYTLQFLYKFISPSTVSCILAVSIVLINPIHRIFFYDVPTISTPTSPSYSTLRFASAPLPDKIPAPPLKFIAEVIEMLGDASIPLSLTILGSNLYQALKPGTTSHDSSLPSTQFTHRLSLRTIIAVAVIAKLAFMPLFAFGVAYLLSLSGLSVQDSLVLLVLTIEGSSPSAVNLVVLIQIVNCQDVMKTVSFILLFQYIFSIITMPLVVLISVSVFG